MLESFPARAFTVDVYDTLIHFDGADGVFRELLGGQLSPAECLEFRQRYDDGMVAVFRELCALDFRVEPFVTVKELYRRVFAEAAEEFGVALDLDEATRRLAAAVADMPVYPETREFVSRLRRYPHCLVSDIDDDLLAAVLERNGLVFEHVVTSEQAGCYKSSVGSTMFSLAAEKLGVPVSKLIHVGDWLPDVLGAKAAGARVVRVRRHGGTFDRDCPAPDAEADDLLEALTLGERL